MGRKDDAQYMAYIRSLKKPVKKSSRQPASYHKRKDYYSDSESQTDSCSDCSSQSNSDSESDYSD